jgi:hypothetical protein
MSRNPEDYGWTCLGANQQSRVVFYEKNGDRMDYYPTTGTVKTMVDHPNQGRTQMFRRNLSNSQFKQVCLNPRSHTGHGYQTKK